MIDSQVIGSKNSINSGEKSKGDLGIAEKKNALNFKKENEEVEDGEGFKNS